LLAANVVAGITSAQATARADRNRRFTFLPPVEMWLTGSRSSGSVVATNDAIQSPGRVAVFPLDATGAEQSISNTSHGRLILCQTS
jgi:hypothetical protein